MRKWTYYSILTSIAAVASLGVGSALAQDNGENGKAMAEAIIARIAEEAAPDFVADIQKELCDDAVDTGYIPDVSTGSFTVAMRVKLFAQGNEPGNNGTNGMLYCVSSGYTDGFRAYYDWPNGRFVFEVGKEGGANGCSTELRYVPGVTRDIVCVCDAYTKRLTLYVDGVAAAGCPHVSDIVDKKDALRVGFCGNGVGSNRMYVEKIEYWNRPLIPEDVQARQALRDPEEVKIAKIVDTVNAFGDKTVNLDLANDPALNEALEMDVPQAVKDAVNESAVVNALNSKNFPAAAPAVFKNAEDYIAKRAENASQDPTPAQLSAYGEVVSRLRAMQNVSRYAKEVRSWLGKIRMAYPAEAAEFDKIEKLEASADRVRKIEKDALSTYERVVQQFSGSVRRRTIRVAPGGNDATGNGSATAPYATLARAFEDVAANAAVKTVTIVELAAGKYQVEKTAYLKNVENVYVRPVKGAKVELLGGRAITNFVALADANDPETAQRFNEAVRDKIYVADLAAAGFKNFGKQARRGYGVGNKVAPIPSLYFGGESQTLARWPNDGDETLKFGEKVPNTDENDETTTFKYDYDRVDSWKNVDDLWAFGLYEWEWAANLRKVAKLDREKKEVTFDYRNSTGRFDYYYVNVLEELDVPGEYFVDSVSGKLYFYPPVEVADAAELNNAKVEYDEFEDLFVSLENVRNFVVEDIAFRLARESFGKFVACERCYVNDCAIEQMGGNALSIEGGANCGVLNTRIREMGASGVRVSGGDRDTLTPCKHLVYNNFISDFSRIDRVYTPAVHAVGCGIAITNNLMCDSPHHAMRTDGNDLYIARNEVHSCVYEYSDQAGIDIFCDPSFRGIVIEKNLWRHIGSSFALCGQAGIRLDDSISGVLMLDNVFYRSSGGAFGGIQIHGGKDNLAKGNLMVDCKQAFSFNPWAGTRYRDFVRERFPQHVGNATYIKNYPFFDEIDKHIDRNYILDNVAVNCGSFNNHGSTENVFSGNRNMNADPDFSSSGIEFTPEQYAEEFYTDPVLLRSWLEVLAKRSLKEIGLKGKWNGANVDVTPKFRNIEKN